MKALISIIMLGGLAVAAPQSNTKTNANTKKTAPPVAQPTVLPKDAVANPDGSYSWTDKDGKKWIFNKTPFGITKMADVGKAQASAAEPKNQYVKATDQGDTVKFERQSPFGTKTWEKKKSELNDEEREILQHQNPPSTTQNPQPQPWQQPL